MSEQDLEICPASAGLADCPGFRVAGVSCDVRNKGDNRLDLALFVTEPEAAAAAVFTKHALPAAPIQLGRDSLAEHPFLRAVVINSGNANACTGADGLEDALRMRGVVTKELGLPHESLVLVSSTGRIGERLPMERLTKGIAEGASRLTSDSTEGERAADAILTSDTRRKVATIRFRCQGKTLTLAGMAKGAGMIEPNMATMLAFLATDAAVDPAFLKTALREAVQDSFNAITVDGDQSTNDTVLLMANGHSGVFLETDRDRSLFTQALRMLCQDLAEKIVGDGEKITKVVEILVEQAHSKAEAEKAARAIGNSLLVKSSWYGNDPNWGRVADAVGYSAAAVAEDTLEIYYDTVPAFLQGKPCWENREQWRKIVAEPRFTLRVVLGQGDSSYRLLASDLTEGYVNFNKSE
ncbi:MAG: bifunctional glutamate N-acetyltransferase/amino-acid acetyltransferase ArgJ [Opitutales bacterium]|nr:bifunctional glutamate N-acetyltransferase/amino-acid acetyltransferase ArgJ [Opitutales bacterium]